MLATQFAQLPGYPYVTLVPNVFDECHRPLLLVSAFAEHMRNFLADHRVSLSLVESGIVNVQTAACVTLQGDAEWFEPDQLLKARYPCYLPDAEQYLELDFMFFRVTPKRVRFIAGVGKRGGERSGALCRSYRWRAKARSWKSPSGRRRPESKFPVLTAMESITRQMAFRTDKRSKAMMLKLISTRSF